MNTLNTVPKGAPMTKSEVFLLLDLIANKPIVTRKGSTAPINLLKRQGWAEIEHEFNSKSNIMRSREQLSLKWENLKKNCRKKFKENADKDYIIAQDAVMERVQILLNNSCAGLEVADAGLEDRSDNSCCSFENNINVIEEGTNEYDDYPYTVPKVEKGEVRLTDSDKAERLKQLILDAKSKDDGVRERNMAIAKYFEKKTEKLDIEIKLLKIRLLNKKRKLMEDIDI